MAKAKDKGKPATPKEPDIRALERAEIITDNHPGTPTPKLEAPDHRGELPRENVTIQNDNFDRLNTLESIAKKHAEEDGIEYDDTPIYKKEDFQQVHGPAGRLMEGEGKRSEPAKTVESPKLSPEGETEPDKKPDAPTVKIPTPAAVLPGDKSKETPIPGDSDSKLKTEPQQKPFKFQVDGEEITLTEDQVRAYVQKGAAADKRLQDVSEALKRVKELEERYKSGQPQVSVSREPVQSRPGDSSPPTGTAHLPARQVSPELRARAREFVKSAQFGDEQEAVDKLLDFTLNSSPQINEEKFIDTVADRFEEKRLRKEIRAAFELPPEQGGYGDIAADPVLYRSIGIELENAVTPTEHGGLGMDPYDWNTYKVYGDKFRRDYLSHRVDSKNLEEKKEDKRNLETIPQANVAPVPGVREAPPEDPNPSATIQEMARARGQQY